MALETIILEKGKLIVTLVSSIGGLIGTNVALNFGYIQKVNQLTDKFIVGQTVMFDITNAIQFMEISGTKFFLINESDIQLIELDV